MGLAKWESFLEDHIEGFFNKRFSSALEPLELVKSLERESLRRCVETEQGKMMPNDYTLFMNAEDYQRLCSDRIVNELYEAVEKQVIRQDCLMDGTLRVRLQKHVELKKGMLDVQSCFTEQVVEEDKDEPHTLVLERKTIQQPLPPPVEHRLASLTVLEGVDRDAYLEFGEKQIFIGRREQNDFILTDANVSRVHASIRYERHRHILCDAKSLNGTWLQEDRVDSICLQSGDRIRVGHTILLYEVI